LLLIYSEAGMFNAIMSFPADYPQLPPKLRFTTPSAPTTHPPRFLLAQLT